MKKVILKSMLLFVAILFVGIAQAQTVTGTVTEENGPLPGANVIVKGTSNGATTDFDGNYSLNNVPNDATLVFSYVGYATQEVSVGGRSTINVSLATDNALDEVVLIGYGTTTIKDATGTIDNVSEKDFNQGVIQSPEQLIQGKTAGVTISESSGEPGAGISVNIRGSNSVRANNNPLFVVDGIPLAGGGAPANGVGGVGATSGGNPLSFLNPNDIESISILKDASATAIYGSRGANGVVIVQTKQGRGASKGVWELGSTVSSSVAANRYDLLNARQFTDALNVLDIDPLPGNADTDWQDFYTREAFSRQTNLSYSKSYGTGNVRVSGSYSNTNGVIEDSNLERYSGRVNFSQRFFDDKLTLTGTGAISQVDRGSPPLDGTVGSTGDLIGASLSASPLFPLEENLLFGQNTLNPISLLNNYLAESKSTRILANISAKYDFTENFNAKVTLGYDNTDSQTITAFNQSVQGLNGVSGIGRGSFNTVDQTNTLLEATLNYKKEFGNIKVDVLGGFSYQKFDRNGIFAQGAGFGGDNLDVIHTQLSDQYGLARNSIEGGFQVFGYGTDGSYVSRLFPEIDLTGELGDFERLIPAYTAGIFDNFDELQSYFVRANISFNEKFLFTGTMRADGSTLFGANERYGYFPSGAFAWQVHEEDFIGDTFSTLKLRVGAGSVGNQEGLGFGGFLFRTVAQGGGISNNLEVLPRPGTEQVGNFPNPDLKWENTIDLNVGVDFGFNNDRLNGSINVYRKETNDLLIPVETAAPGAGGTFIRNLDDTTVVNQGVEFSVNYDFINTEDWGFDVGFNVAYNDNVVEGLRVPVRAGALRGAGLTGAAVQRLEAGQPIFSFFLPVFEGFDDQGQPIYEDVNGDGTGDPFSDQKFVGENALPDVTAGLNLTARYKNFDISTYFNGQFGFSVYNLTANALFNQGQLANNKNVTQNVAQSEEAASATADPSTRFLEKGDFVRLTSASIGYNFPLSGEGFFDSLRFNLTGQNLFLITGYSGLDPEVSTNTGDLDQNVNIPSRGIDYLQFPRARTITLGVNARF